MTVPPSKFDCQIATLDEARFAQALAERCQNAGVGVRCTGAEKSDNRQIRALRARRNRPHRSTTNNPNKLPPLHSITSSARASSDGGTVRPSALAVLRLIRSWNFVTW